MGRPADSAQLWVRSLREQKREVRRQVLARRAALPATLRRDQSALAAAHLRWSAEYRRARTVLAFAAFRDELDTQALLLGVLADGKRLVLPVTVPEQRTLELKVVASLADLRPGTWDIPEPPQSAETCPLAELDLVVLPGVAFDLSGRRLGYGGGYYDGLLRRLGRETAANQVPPLWGLGLEAQVVPEVPAGPDDESIDALVTETGIRRFSPRKAGQA